MQLLLTCFPGFRPQQRVENIDRKATRYLENTDADVMEKPEEELYKLWPTQLNREIFSSIISSGSRHVVEEKYPLIRLRRKRKPEPRSNLVEAYLFFYDQIAKWTLAEADARHPKSQEDCAFALLQAIQQDFCVVDRIVRWRRQPRNFLLAQLSRPPALAKRPTSKSYLHACGEGPDRDALFRDFWGAFETNFWSFEVSRGGEPIFA